jgi:hypothetical protein
MQQRLATERGTAGSDALGRNRLAAAVVENGGVARGDEGRTSLETKDTPPIVRSVSILRLMEI